MSGIQFVTDEKGRRGKGIPLEKVKADLVKRKIWSGSRENARQLPIDRPELRQTIEGEIRRALGMGSNRKSAEFELTTVA